MFNNSADNRPGGRVKCAPADLLILKGARHGDVNAAVTLGDETEEIALYNGRLCVGHYLERAGSWHASGGDHQGTYPTRKAAIYAILDAAVLA